MMLKFKINNKLAEKWPDKFKKIISLKSFKELEKKFQRTQNDKLIDNLTRVMKDKVEKEQE